MGAHVSHPNVAAAIDFGQLDDGGYYLVLELVRGVTLREVVRKGPLPVRRGLRVAHGIAAGLAHLHERGIVHRDLKPANVMLVDGTSSDVKLIDFGLARVQADGTLGRELSTSSGQWQAITDHGNFFGTVAYLAPGAQVLEDRPGALERGEYTVTAWVTYPHLPQAAAISAGAAPAVAEVT